MRKVFVYTVKPHRENHGALSQLSDKRRKEIFAIADARQEFELALHAAVAKHATITNPPSQKRESGTFASVIIRTNDDDGCEADCPHCREEEEQIRKCVDAIGKSDCAILALPSVCGGSLVETILISCGNPKRPVPLLLLTEGPVSTPRRLDSMNCPCFNAGYGSLEEMEGIVNAMFTEPHLFMGVQRPHKVS